MRWISSFMLEWCIRKWDVHVQCAFAMCARRYKVKVFQSIVVCWHRFICECVSVFLKPIERFIRCSASTLLILHENRTHVPKLTHTHINQILQSKHMRLTLASTECQCGWIHCKLFFRCALLLLPRPPLLPFWFAASPRYCHFAIFALLG